MSQLRVVLFNSPVVNFNRDKYKQKSQDKSTVFDTMYEQQEHTDYLCHGRTKNGLINAFLMAYNEHVPLAIKPDDIHVALQIVFSTYINNNAEALRQVFVDHQDKKELTAKMTNFDFNTFTDNIYSQMKENMKDGNLLNILNCTYSTTTPIISCVSKAIVMNTFQAYFSYACELMCGIPELVLLGTISDWDMLFNKYCALRDFCLTLEKCELRDWFQCMNILMTMFRDLRCLQESGTVDAPPEYVNLWSRAITHVPYGSGGGTRLGGWIHVLVPYAASNKLKPFFKNLPCLDTSKEVPDRGKFRGYDYQKEMAKYYGSTTWDDIQDSMLSTPVKFTNENIDATMYSGFSQDCYVSSDNIVSVNYRIKITKVKQEFTDKLKELHQNLDNIVKQKQTQSMYNTPYNDKITKLQKKKDKEDLEQMRNRKEWFECVKTDGMLLSDIYRVIENNK